MGALEQLLKKEKVVLPPLPNLVQKILQNLLTKSESELEAFLINEDEISSFLIEIANSPLFRRGEATITHSRVALMILGDTTAKILVLGLISQKITRTTLNEFSFPKFWARALSQAVATYFLSDLIENIPPHLPISAYLMDYGIILLYLINAEKYLQVLSLKAKGIPLIEAEREIFGVTHPEIASDYFEDYAFPRRFILNLRYHHADEESLKELPKEIRKDIELLSMVDHLVGSFFSLNREERWAHFKKKAQAYLKEEEIEAIGEVFPRTANTYLSIINLEEFKLKTLKELEKEKEEEMKKIQFLEVEKERETALTIETLKNKFLELQRQRGDLERELLILRNRYREFSILDELIEIYKEEYFIKRLNEELIRAKRYGRIFSLLYLVIDKLEEIGKKYGLGEEEEFLKVLASEFKKLLRRCDLIAKAKVWNSFYILLPETSAHGAMVVARKLLRKIEEIFYKKYHLKHSALIAIINFDPNKMDPKRDTPLPRIFSLLESGIAHLRRGHNKVLLLKIEKELETQG